MKIVSFLSNPFKTETISLCEKKICCLLFSNISVSSRDIQVLKMCKLAKWWRHSLIQPNFDQIWWKKISQLVLTEMFNSLQYDSTNNCAPQYKLNSFVTMAVYWVPDLPNIKRFSGHLWNSILIFAKGASYAWSSKHILL